MRNHAKDLVAVESFVVLTATFRVLYAFVVLAQERRRVLHFYLTDCPSAAWTAQEPVEAFPYAAPPRHLLRNCDRIYGAEFVQRTTALGCEQKPIIAGCPWQYPFVERLIGSVRRECLDHLIVLNAGHLRTTLSGYFEQYHAHRTHRGLGEDCLKSRAIESPRTRKRCRVAADEWAAPPLYAPGHLRMGQWFSRFQVLAWRPRDPIEPAGIGRGSRRADQNS